MDTRETESLEAGTTRCYAAPYGTGGGIKRCCDWSARLSVCLSHSLGGAACQACVIRQRTGLAEIRQLLSVWAAVLQHLLELPSTETYRFATTRAIHYFGTRQTHRRTQSIQHLDGSPTTLAIQVKQSVRCVCVSDQYCSN